MVPTPVFLIGDASRCPDIGRRVPVQVLRLPVAYAASSIEALAASYVTVIQRAQPFGPYRILGDALGALVAYELVTQLLGRDEVVEFFGMIGCARPRNRPLHAIDAWGPAAMAERYCPQPLPIPVYYFASQTTADAAATRSWRALAGDSLRVIAAVDALTDELLADAIARAPRQQFLQSATEHAHYRPLLTIRIGDVHTVPVIFAPGAGDSVTSGLELAESVRDWATIHGLQARGFDGTAVPHLTVQAASSVYLRAIREVQPSGPYRLAGHSFGGWVVFELACRLAAEGATVDPIVLLDSEAPRSATAEPMHDARLQRLMKLIRVLEASSARAMDLRREELAALDYESQLSRLAQGMKALGVLPRNGDVNDIRGLVRVFEANLNTSYVPTQRFPGCALLLQASESADPEGRGEAWRDHVGHLECVAVPGQHLTMLKKPRVEVIAGILTKLWSEHSRAATGPTHSCRLQRL